MDRTYYTVVRCSYGSIVGYRNTKLTWPNASKGALIAKEGETVTSVLDKIVNLLSDYEYFYDLNGKFVFQRKLTYVNTSWNNLETAQVESSYTTIARSNLVNDLNAILGLTQSELIDEVYAESSKLVS